MLMPNASAITLVTLWWERVVLPVAKVFFIKIHRSSQGKRAGNSASYRGSSREREGQGLHVLPLRTFPYFTLTSLHPTLMGVSWHTCSGYLRRSYDISQQPCLFPYPVLMEFLDWVITFSLWCYINYVQWCISDHTTMAAIQGKWFPNLNYESNYDYHKYLCSIL